MLWVWGMGCGGAAEFVGGGEEPPTDPAAARPVAAAKVTANAPATFPSRTWCVCNVLVFPDEEAVLAPELELLELPEVTPALLVAETGARKARRKNESLA